MPVSRPDISSKRSIAGRAGARARWSAPRQPPQAVEHLRMTKDPSDVANGRRQVWYSIKNKTSDNPEVYILDEIGYFGVNASNLVNELQKMDADTITVFINSPGGEVFEGLAIYDALRSHPASIEVKVMGIAASAASFIAMAGDRIVMAKHGQLMIHNARGLCIGDADDMQNFADLLDKQSDNIATMYAARAGKDVDYFREKMAAETWYGAEEALGEGLVDEVDDYEDEVENAFDLTVFNFAGRENAPDPAVAPASTSTSAKTPDPAPAKVETVTINTKSIADIMKEALSG